MSLGSELQVSGSILGPEDLTLQVNSQAGMENVVESICVYLTLFACNQVVILKMYSFRWEGYEEKNQRNESPDLMEEI